MNLGFFEAFYQSPIQHPILLWVSNLLGTALALSARPVREDHSGRTRRFILIWSAISALDAWATANFVYGIGVLSSPWSAVVPFLFVWLGDFRIFYAMEAFATPKRPGILRPLLACFLVPVLAGALTRGQEARILFLVYEGMFLVWIALYGRWTWLSAHPASRTIRNLALVFYSLWVFADCSILFLPAPWRDLGFGIRVIPNFIYYGWFGWAVARALEGRASWKH